MCLICTEAVMWGNEVQCFVSVEGNIISPCLLSLVSSTICKINGPFWCLHAVYCWLNEKRKMYLLLNFKLREKNRDTSWNERQMCDDKTKVMYNVIIIKHSFIASLPVKRMSLLSSCKQVYESTAMLVALSSSSYAESL